MRSLLVLVVLACCGLLAASPARPRRSLALPDGIPLELLFGACGDGSDSDDIGPCVEELLSGLIELAAPSFETGLDIGNKTVVLEPLSLKDIPARPGKKVRVSARDVTVHGLSTVRVENVSLLADRLALTLSFAELRASADMSLQVLVFTGQPHVEVTLARPSIRVTAAWELRADGNQLNIRLSSPDVSINIQALSARVTNLGTLGGFLQKVIDRSDGVLLQVFKPALEKKARHLLEKEFGTIKLAS